jgi:hypothetical protein
VFGDLFDHPVDHLTPTLTHLSFGKCFNKNVDKLPPSLIYLKFGTLFLQEVQKYPPTLQELKYDNMSLGSIDALTPTIHTLIFRGDISAKCPITSLPPSLTSLELTERYHEAVKAILKIAAPPLKQLIIYDHPFGQDEFDWSTSSLDSLPTTLTTLVIESQAFNLPLNKLPPSLTLQLYRVTLISLWPTFLLRSPPSI